MFYLLHLTEEMSEESKQRRKAEHEDLLTVSIFVLEVCPVWTEFCENFFFKYQPSKCSLYQWSRKVFEQLVCE